MYNGIGLTTARGSGTNGHVQRNFAFVRPGKKDNISYRTDSDLAKLDAATNRAPNQELLDHERKRKVEVKCAELEEILEKQGYTAEEMTLKVDAFRNKLLEQKNSLTTTDEFGRIQARDTHQIAEAQQEKNARLREAFGISNYFVEGSSFDPERIAKEELAKSAALQQELQLRKEAEKNQSKRYTIVKTPSPEPVAEDKDTSIDQQNSESRKSKKQKKKKSKKNKKEKSKKKKSRKHESSSNDNDSDSEDSSAPKKSKSKKTHEKDHTRTSKRQSSPSISRKDSNKSEPREDRGRHEKSDGNKHDKSQAKSRQKRTRSRSNNHSHEKDHSEPKQSKRRKQSTSRSPISRGQNTQDSRDRNIRNRNRSPVRNKRFNKSTESRSPSLVHRRRRSASIKRSNVRKSRSPQTKYNRRRSPNKSERKRSRSRSDSRSKAERRSRSNPRKHEVRSTGAKSDSSTSKRLSITPDRKIVEQVAAPESCSHKSSNIDHSIQSARTPSTSKGQSSRWDVAKKVETTAQTPEGTTSTLDTHTPSTRHGRRESRSSRSSSLEYSPVRRSPNRYKTAEIQLKSEKASTKSNEIQRRTSDRSHSRGKTPSQGSSAFSVKSTKEIQKFNTEKQSNVQKDRAAPIVRLMTSSESESETGAIDQKGEYFSHTEEQRDLKLLEALPGIAARAKEKIKIISEAVISPQSIQATEKAPMKVDTDTATLAVDKGSTPTRQSVADENAKKDARPEKRYSDDNESSDDSSSDSSKSRSSASIRSSSSSSYSSVASNRSRRSSRSPSIPRRRGSPSFLDRRRITSARKRPIPYHRSTPTSLDSDSEDDDCDDQNDAF